MSDLNSDLNFSPHMIGVISALNVIAEVLVARGITSAPDLANILRMRRNDLATYDDGAEAARVLEWMIRPLESPERATFRDFLKVPPSGGTQ